MTEMSPLRRRMIEDMTVRNLSPAIQRSYVHAVAKFARFFGRSPATLDLEDVRAFQVHLVAGGMSWPALNQTVCALRFLYGVTLRQADLPERIAYAREPQQLPVVLRARARITASSVWSPSGDSVVPFIMKGIWFDVEGCHLVVGDLDALLISIGIKLTGNGEASLGGGAGDQLDDGQVADQRLGAPVHGDEGEQLVLDAVPFTGAG
jgi:hypothetical protein